MAAAIGVAGGPVGEWTTVYLIERSLSLDNVFLFTLLLAYFAVPAELRGPVVTIGLAGALVLREVAIVVGVALIGKRRGWWSILLLQGHVDLRGSGRRGGRPSGRRRSP